MLRLVCFAIFICTGLSQVPGPGVLEDLLQIYNTGTVNLIDCAGIEVLLSNINFTLYTEQNQQNGILLNITNLNQVNASNPVIFIIHGWLQNGNKGWVLQMVSTYFLSIPYINIIVVDWSFYSGVNYGATFCAVPQVGIYVGDLIYNLTITPGINLNNTKINGFSMGAHAGGYAGQQVQNRTGTKIWQINGLDAAGPGYNGLPANQRLDASDAFFVQGIHTNKDQFGYNLPYGAVDFNVNFVLLIGCGVQQNGCPLYPGVPTSNDLSVLLPYFFCNHIRAIVYFIESILSTNFLGVACTSCSSFGIEACKFNPTVVMGEHCPSTASGEKYLNTNFNAPFAKGTAGI